MKWCGGAYNRELLWEARGTVGAEESRTSSQGSASIMARKIGILGGTGPEGSGLAYRWARAGEHIVIGSRDAQRAAETAAQLRARIGGTPQSDGTGNAAAVAPGEIGAVAVPFSR